MEEIFSKLEDYIDDFEIRSEQIQLAEKVKKVIEEKKHLICEAPTGVGKTFAYLVPILQYIEENSDKSVVISTGTKLLQDQIFEKDFPVIEELLDKTFNAIQVKGKSNYLCRYKLTDVFQKIFSKGDESSINSFFELQKSEGYERKDFPNVNDYVWSLVHVDNDCIGRLCPFVSSCKYLQVKTSKANVIFVNHHLLLSDLQLKIEGTRILPDYDILVIDEAHKFYETFLSVFTKRFNSKTFLKELEILFSITSANGILTLFKDFSSFYSFKSSKKTVLDRVDSLIDKIQKNFSILKDKSNFLSLQRNEKVRSKDINNTDFNSKVKFYKGFIDDIISDITFILNNTFVSEIEDDNTYAYILSKLNSILNLFNDYTYVFNFFFKDGNNSVVSWAEEENESVSLCCIDLNSSKYLKKYLYDKVDSVIFTSATLSTNGDFKYFSETVGCTENYETLLINTSFDLRNNSRMIFPFYNSNVTIDNRFGEFMQLTSALIQSVVSHIEGKTFVLFTSFEMLNFVFNKTKDFFKNVGIEILKQGDKQTYNLLEDFRKKDKVVLYGTKTFWEGIDIKGEKLSCVIIPRLPFSVPNDPVTQGRIEQIKKEGKNWFIDFVLPESLILLKQGVGRLIRGKQDKGVIFILDNRIFKKSYGSIFFKTFSNYPFVTLNWQEEFKKFFSN